MKKLLFVICLGIMFSFNVEARPHHVYHPVPHHHVHKPIVRHHSYHRGWQTFGEVVAGTVIGSLLVRDTYVTYNQRVNVPQHCVTLVNQSTGMITTQCAQDSNQVIYITE